MMAMLHNPAAQLNVAHRSHAAAALAKAFHNDPVYAAVVPDHDRRAALLMWLFDRVVSYALLYGQVNATAASEGAACWLPPGQSHLTLPRLVRSGLYATPLKMGWTAYRRFDTYMSYADHFHARYAPASHWYLWAIGVDPQHQGQGIGSTLLATVLERASADGVACYLETGTEKNVRFYARHGFKVVAEGQAPGLGVPVWAMVREAAAMPGQ